MQTLVPTTTNTAMQPDWLAWAGRWEDQHNLLALHRQERFGVMLEIADEIVGEPKRILDLACGTARSANPS